MTDATLIHQSRRHYRRYYRLVAFAVIVMMAVLSGSLLLGDSVRGTLTQRVAERLGRTETVITSGTGFMSEALMQQPLLAGAQGYLLVDGFVSVDDKLLPVYVWGTDADSLEYGDVLVGDPLAEKLADAEDIVLHLPSHNLVPSGTLFVTQSYATQMRLHVAGRKSAADGGNLLLRNEQTLPLNVFIGRQQLAEAMELEGKINLVLSDQIITKEQLADIWTPELSGYHIMTLLNPPLKGGLNDTKLPPLRGTEGVWKSEGVLEVTYDGIFIPEEIVSQMQPCQTYFSYLVNDLICGTDTVPYSFVTAVSHWQDEPLTGADVILSDYAAERLHVNVDDSLSMSYFLAKDLKDLQTRQQQFRVKAIVPLADFMQDSLLTAEFPGLSNVERCTDWDSDLPIKMDRVHKIDEDFWYAYRQTPKALVAYEAVRADWSNAFGSATALRKRTLLNPQTLLNPPLKGDWGVYSSDQMSLRPHKGERVPTRDGGGLKNSNPSPFKGEPEGVWGLQLIHPRAEGMQAAEGGVDFASLFLALGAFIILSAILLMASPLQEMFAERRNELRLYQQLGFSQRKVAAMLLREAFGVMCLVSPLGILAGILYSGTTLWLLGNVWSGATHTEGFALHIQPMTLLAAWAVGLIVCATLTLLKTLLNPQTLLNPPLKGDWGVYSSDQMSLRPHKGERVPTRDGGGLNDTNLPPLRGTEGVRRPGVRGPGVRRLGGPVMLPALITFALTAANFVWLHSMALFIVCGLLWILTFGLFLRAYIIYKVQAHAFSRSQLIWHTIRASMRQHLLAYWTLSLGVFTVFAVGLNRPDFGDAEQLAGGCQLYVESRVPIQYDLGDQAVRRKLSLDGLPAGTEFLSFMRHTQDEASCLNLNKVSTPTVLGADSAAMAAFGLPTQAGEARQAPHGEGCAEVFIDQEALMWSLMKSVGDTLYYQDAHGDSVPVRIAGSYPTGIFHGNAIMPAHHFRRLWPRENGIEVLLVKSPAPAQAAEQLSMAMSEYGLSIQTAQERLRMFFEVTETYLIIFLTLGGLGLLLGIFSLIIIVRKNLTAQRATIRQYRAMGFPDSLIRQLLLRQNLLVPLFAVAVGATGSFISTSQGVGQAGLHTILSAATLLALLCLGIYFGIKELTTTITKEKKLETSNNR